VCKLGLKNLSNYSLEKIESYKRYKNYVKNKPKKQPLVNTIWNCRVKRIKKKSNGQVSLPFRVF
jgi:hypothetical protein